MRLALWHTERTCRNRRCAARIEFWSNTTGRPEEVVYPCTCPDEVIPVEDPHRMTGQCQDCGGVCRDTAKRCTKCGNEAWYANRRKRYPKNRKRVA